MARSGKPPPSQRNNANPRLRRSRSASSGDAVPASALTIWKEKDLTQFKLGVIELDETGSNSALEKAARARASDVDAAIVYAYLLDTPVSTAWWREWAGYDLEEDLLRAAVLARPAVRARLNSFDPKDNEWGVDNREDFADLLIHAHHAEIDEDDIRKGFRSWLASLPPDARRLFAADLKKWMRA
ncbi:hypothetical protein [Minwuia sp.]|uniref:hypothetical protein n=1 Tax=Minwuia sp. TaxID=2493630 RepID=UPI003A92DD33